MSEDRQIFEDIQWIFQTMNTVPEPGSHLAEIDESLDVSVPISSQLYVALSAAVTNLQVLHDSYSPNREASPWVIAPPARCVLVSASRVLYVLLPDSSAERLHNATRVAKGNAQSHKKLITAMQEVEHLKLLQPPRDIADKVLAAPGGIDAPNVMETEVITSAVDFVTGILKERQSAYRELVSNPEILGEHVKWIFNVYSGLTHGLPWPLFVPTSRKYDAGDLRRMPGDWPTDLKQITAFTHLAAVKFMEFCKADPAEGRD